MARRIFNYEGREFPDPSPTLSVDEVRQEMAKFFPELSNAEVNHSKRGEDDVYDFKRRTGTKGCAGALMTKEEYLEVQQRVLLLTEMIKHIPLKDFIFAAEHAEHVGPILDPTLYRAAAGSLATIKRRAEDLLAVQVHMEEEE